MMHDRQMGNRIRELRESRGLKLYELAEKLDTDPPQLSRWETGKREPDNDTIERIAEALDSTPAAVMGWEVSEIRARIAPLVGYAGVAGMVFFDARVGQWGTIEEVEAPPGTEGLRALRVMGKALEPSLSEGDLLFFSEERHPPEAFAGKKAVCVAQTASGDVYVRRIVATEKPGRYRLELHSTEALEAEVVWCSPVIWVRKVV